MNAYIIEARGEVKEAFKYDRPLNTGSEIALGEYARSTYGAEATVRKMTEQEAADFILHGPEFLVKKD
jgi:hypothetical protein